ncbi:unnamed protein product, partial [Phaeothamnion confervicola]
IVAWNLLRDASSPVSSSLTCLQGPDRVAVLSSQQWDPHIMFWQIVPCHRDYAASNAPLRHVSTARSGAHVAVAGAAGLALYSAAQRRWRVFGDVDQERNIRVSGLCWWGDDAVAAVVRSGGGAGPRHQVLLYPRTHLEAKSVLHGPVTLPLGLLPAFV